MQLNFSLRKWDKVALVNNEQTVSIWGGLLSLVADST